MSARCVPLQAVSRPPRSHDAVSEQNDQLASPSRVSCDGQCFSCRRESTSSARELKCGTGCRASRGTRTRSAASRSGRAPTSCSAPRSTAPSRCGLPACLRPVAYQVRPYWPRLLSRRRRGVTSAVCSRFISMRLALHIAVSTSIDAASVPQHQTEISTPSDLREAA